MPRSSRTARRTTAFAAVVAAAALAVPAAANAAYSSSISGTTVTLTGDDVGEALTISETAGNLSHSLTGNGFNSPTDFDSVAAGDQVLPADDTIALVVNAGGGDDAVTVTTANLASVTVDGQAGDDVITGNNDNDALRGGDGDDRVVGARGADDMEGGAGNDTLVWNNGDGSDVMDGDAGADDIEVNGAATQGDEFTVKPNGARVRFDRVNLVPFNLDIGSSERLVINGLGGADKVTGEAGIAALGMSLAVDGGVGEDQITGADSSDLIRGGDDVDNLAGGGGADRILGDRGDDVMAGGPGDDVLVWDPGTGTDKMDGDDGLDRIEVNGGGIAENFAIAPNGARAKFERVSPAPFSLDIGASEALDLHAAGGDDTFVAAPSAGTQLAITVDGGAGNDTLTGSDSPDTLVGGSGNDTITGNGGFDALDGELGDDSIRARDGVTDLVRGGPGNDSAETDAPNVDAIDSIESLSALAAADVKGTPLQVRTSSLTLRRRTGGYTARISVQCPAAEAGGCKGTLTLVSRRTVRIGGIRIAVVLGSARYNLKAGQRRTLNVRTPGGLRLISRGRAIAAQAHTVTTDGAGNTAEARKNLSLRLPR